MGGVLAAEAAVLLQLYPLTRVGLVLGGDVVAPLARLAGECDRRSLVAGHVCSSSLVPGAWCLVPGYLWILTTRPAPTVRPPSRMANRRPSSIAIGLINSTPISVLSPGIPL